MRNITRFVLALVISSPLAAHHSNAGLDMSSLVSFEGTVTDLSWRNPHIYFTVETMAAQGEPIEWTLQMGSTITTIRMGWRRESLAVGDRVKVSAYPARSGRPNGMLYSIEKEGGIVLPTSFDQNTAEPIFAELEETASTNSLEGTWMAKNSELTRYAGGFDGFFTAQLKLTEKGTAAQAAYDVFTEENPESECIGRPTPAMIVSSNLFPMQIAINPSEAIILIRSQIWDEERTVYMDGRSHPENNERFPSGHSTGRWDGDTLVVDTTNFSDHRSPYQIGVPSGAGKHVVERYRLNAEGTRITVEFVLEDREYVAEPLIHTRDLIYAPQIEMTRFNCDPATARRFLSR